MARSRQDLGRGYLADQREALRLVVRHFKETPPGSAVEVRS